MSDTCMECGGPMDDTDDPLGEWCGACFDRHAEAHWEAEEPAAAEPGGA